MQRCEHCDKGFSNPAELLHPIELWVEIMVDGEWIRAIRDQVVERRSNDRVYRTEEGNHIVGKFRWRYL